MSEHDLDRNEEGRVDGRWMIAVFAVVVLGVGVYLAVAMPGMDHGSGDMSSMPNMSTRMPRAISVNEFSVRMARPDAFVINVHVPDEGSIPTTSVEIAYDRIGGDKRLPSRTSTPILLYCKTGPMATKAAATLAAAGYTNVVTLKGGMDAWAEAGRPLLHGTG